METSVDYYSRLRGKISWIILFISFMVLPLNAQENCDGVVSKAQKQYDDFGRSKEVVEMLMECLPGKIPDVQKKVQAYRLLALAQIDQDNLDKARDAIRKLLELKENYEPLLNDRATFIKFVEDAKNERLRLAEKSTGNKKWFLIGGSGLLAGLVVFLASQSEDAAKPLPDPPGIP